jgi:YbbR domain-containing protein
MTRLPGFITRNFRLKVLCALIALVTWVGVVYAGNPPEEKTFSVAVPQQAASIPAGYQLVKPIPDLQLRIGGSRANLDAFSAATALSVSVNWHVVTQPGIQQVPVSISNSDSAVELIDPPASVTADLDSIGSESLPVTIHITNLPPPGYVISAQTVSPSSLVVTGPVHELTGLVVRVDVDLGNRKTNFEGDIVPLVFDSHGDQVGDVGLYSNSQQVQSVLVTIVVTSAQATRSVAVVPNLQGTSTGHELTGYTCSPLTVVLRGPQDLLNGLDAVATAPIYLAGDYGTVTKTVGLELPAGVTSAAGSVTVTLYFKQLPTPTAPPSPSATPTPSPTTT